MPNLYQVSYKKISEIIWERKLNILVMALHNRKYYEINRHEGTEDQQLLLQESERESFGGYFLCRK